MSDGVLVIDKPAGMTSHDVVDRVRKTFKTKRVGHAGTLDPDATGVLVLGLGRATRLLAYAQTGRKTYEATGVLGVSTTTLDAAGEVTAEETVDVDRAQVDDVASRFVGEIEQVPPMVSAVKVDGERLYKKARRGETVERPARRVTIYELEIVDFRSPELDLLIGCSGGTYIRTLISDIGDALGCGAHMKRLRRTEAGGFSITDAVSLDGLGPEHLLPITAAVNQLDRLEIDADQAGRVAHGQKLELPGPLDVAEDQAIALVRGSDLLAVYRRRQDLLVPDRVLAADGS
ncbi:MAG: tRNA pseudouridine55 synthase [Actinomycetota bacterium]|jgi:tRNA pseudouridine55 synthase|nr:tRNA pseudouridine55 synthase [Actinomycetota bacterium]